ncbi:uncharacterized protein LOC132545222 [Ylistrum balloti]|uniref:uncharacterized protein LOC132545222 n=1 Tax=Ylistrum balloti TaxID=509963 RepID=UPI002905BB50|nr:uncharacterized protein LOC132545222 [Ylistrum balloti]
MGKKTDYITYQNSSKIKGKIKINIMDPPDKESYKPKLLVLGGVVTALIIIIIFALACFIDKHRRKKRDVSIQLPIGRPEVSPNLIINSPQIHTPPVKVGVFYPHLPKELFSESIENPLDKCVQRMMDILTSVPELDVKYLHYDFNNFFDEIDTVSSSPNIILVLCDRLCELSQEVATSDVNITAEQRREIETLLLKRIHQQYYLNSTNIFFVNFEHLKQQENVLGTARKMFTKHKVYSIGPLIETDQHFSKLLHSILSDVISNTKDRQERIKSILSPETI